PEIVEELVHVKETASRYQCHGVPPRKLPDIERVRLQTLAAPGADAVAPARFSYKDMTETGYFKGYLPSEARGLIQVKDVSVVAAGEGQAAIHGDRLAAQVTGPGGQQQGEGGDVRRVPEAAQGDPAQQAL